MAKSLRTVANVEILHAGIEYLLSTGPTTFTPEDLRDVVTAANEDPSIPNPRLKIGHIDPRYNNQAEFDGSPAFGKATNLRLSENGMAVMADYVGVPAWLADIMPVAYPSRSVEGWWNVESQMGKKWRFVLSACSLLGVTWPGCTVLEDLELYYGDDVPPEVQIEPELVAAARQYAGLVAASSSQPGGGPMRTSASANLDDVRRAFYNVYVPENLTEGTLWWWIQAVLTDPNELIIEDDETGQLYRLSYTSDANGVVSFGDAEAVRIDYIPDDRESQKAAASHVAATLAIGRQVLASWPTRAASRPDNATGGAMDPTEVRTALELPADATDEQVHEALLARAGLVTPTGETSTTPPEPPTPPAPTEPPAPEPPAPTPPAPPAPTQTAEERERIAASRALNLPPGTVLVDESTMATIQRTNERLERMEQREAQAERQQLVAAAIAEGRIPPARQEHWLKYLESDFEGGKAVLASLTPNIVPLHERGHAVIAPSAEGAHVAAAALEPEQVSSWSEELFPEVRAQNDRARAVAAGTGFGQRQRVMSDAHYTRR